MSSIFLKQVSRLVKFGTSEDFESAKDAMTAVGSDYSQFPVEIHG
jgi:hypothetical protein